MDDADKYPEESVAPAVARLTDPAWAARRQDPRRLHVYPELPSAPSHVRVAASWTRIERLATCTNERNRGAMNALVSRTSAMHDDVLHFSRAYEPPEPLILLLLPLVETKPRYFVEVGAGPGGSSATFFLEKQWKWPGMLIEPSIPCYRELVKQDRDVHLDASVLWSESGLEKRFMYKEDDALVTHSPRVMEDNESLPEGWLERTTKTLTLTDALINAEQLHSKWLDKIGYMNINTVGSELQVLQGMNFSAYDVPIVTVAHHKNETSRASVFAHMTDVGYTRLLKDAWSTREDWYIKNTLPTLKFFAGYLG